MPVDVSPSSRRCSRTPSPGGRPASISAALRSSSISSPSLKCSSSRTAGCRSACARSSRCSALPWPASFSSSGGSTTPSRSASLRCRRHSFWSLFPRSGPDRYRFPSQGVRISWLVAHIVALLLAYAALCFSLLASVLYLVQERRIKAKLKPGKPNDGTARLAAAARHA